MVEVVLTTRLMRWCEYANGLVYRVGCDECSVWLRMRPVKMCLCEAEQQDIGRGVGSCVAVR